MGKMIRETPREKGSALLMVLLFTLISAIGMGALLFLFTSQAQQIKGEIDAFKAFYLAETGVHRGVYQVKEEDIPETEGYVSFSFAGETVYYSIAANGESYYLINGKGTHRGKEKVLEADILKTGGGSWEGFDFLEYVFGHLVAIGSITWYGDIKTAGIILFQDSLERIPALHGDAYAGYFIEGECDGIGGNPAHRHENSDIPPFMPLNDFEYLINLAVERNGTLTYKGEPLIDNYYDGNVYLQGNLSRPLVIDGPVVVTGDVVIRGVITGQGTLYAGWNIYFPVDLEYQNPAEYPAPHISDEAACDAWVEANKDKDLVVLVADENIVFGDFTQTYWKTAMRGSSEYYKPLYSSTTRRGKEDRGFDFVWDTENEELLGPGSDPAEADDIFGDPGELGWEWNYEDLDQDGTFDDHFEYADFEFWNVFPGDFAYAPSLAYRSIAENDRGNIDSVLFSNHVICGCRASTARLHGSLLSVDICLTGTGPLRYDPRINSRYQDNYQFLNNIGVPAGSGGGGEEGVTIFRWREVF